MSSVISYPSFSHTSIKALFRVTCMGDSSKDHTQRKVLESSSEMSLLAIGVTFPMGGCKYESLLFIENNLCGAILFKCKQLTLSSCVIQGTVSSWLLPMSLAMPWDWSTLRTREPSWPPSTPTPRTSGSLRMTLKGSRSSMVKSSPINRTQKIRQHRLKSGTQDLQ